MFWPEYTMFRALVCALVTRVLIFLFVCLASLSLGI